MKPRMWLMNSKESRNRKLTSSGSALRVPRRMGYPILMRACFGSLRLVFVKAQTHGPDFPPSFGRCESIQSHTALSLVLPTPSYQAGLMRSISCAKLLNNQAASFPKTPSRPCHKNSTAGNHAIPTTSTCDKEYPHCDRWKQIGDE